MTKSRTSLDPKEALKVLEPDQSPALLQALHLMTRDGRINADGLRKIKQVNHLLQFLRTPLIDLFERFDDPSILDVGAGKSYLGFLLYEAALKDKQNGNISALESRADLVKSSQDLAKKLEFSRMQFTLGKAADFQTEQRTHLVMALHACDTATDDAILLGLRLKADYLFLVPCCQAELARKLGKSPIIWSELWDQGIHRREFGSLATNVLRRLFLEAHGYQVTVTELTGWEHSLKNEIIIAKKIHRENLKAKARLENFLKELNLTPYLLEHAPAL